MVRHYRAADGDSHGGGFVRGQKRPGAGKTVILNPAPAPDKLPDELLGLVDYLTPNETELAKLSGIAAVGQADLKRAARLLIEKG